MKTEADLPPPPLPLIFVHPMSFLIFVGINNITKKADCLIR